MHERLTRWDILGMSAGLLLTFSITVVLSRHRVFWEDEMLGWMLLRDPSWRHMLFAYNAGADGGGFSFYLLGRGWLRLFGPSELSFRLLTSTCFGLGFALTWTAARRYYSIPVVAFALFNTWFFSPPFIAHMTEGRFYGLLVLAVSLTFWLVFRLADAPLHVPLRWYLVTFLTHALLTTTHLLGVAFSASFLAASIVLDWTQRRSRPALYIAGAASWLLLLPERANLLASVQVGKPWFWTKAPRLDEILAVYSGSSKEIALVLLLLAVLAGLGALRSSRRPASVLRDAWRTRRPVYVAVASLLLLGIALLIEGAVGTWLFNDRYLLPMTVAVAYVTAELAAWSLSALTPSLRQILAAPWLRAGAALAFGAALLLWDFKHLANFSRSPEDYTAALTAELPKNLPVVCEDAFSFTELLGQQHASGVRYVYLLDWPQAVSTSAPRVEVTQFHLMENWRKVGYFSGSIEPMDEFLRRTPEFLVVHDEPVTSHRAPDIGNPLAERFAHDPKYEVVPYAVLLRDRDREPNRMTVWRVCHGRCGTGGSPGLLPALGRAR